MGGDNVPDDWDSYWRKCDYCGRRYHLSEGGCDCEGDVEDRDDLFEDIPTAEDLDREADEYFDRLERRRERNRP